MTSLLPLPVLAAVIASASVHPAHAATPAPVKPGLWQAQIRTTFTPDPQPGAANWPYLPKPRTAEYPICVDAARARAPMGEPNPTRMASSDAQGYVLRESFQDPRGMVGEVESMYRRVDAGAFEGRQRIAARGDGPMAMTMTLQYTARWVADDCGDVKPRGPTKFGEP